MCTKPGEVAQKSSVKFGEELLSRTGDGLGRKLSLEGSNYEPKPFEGPKLAPKGSHMSFEENDGDDPEEGKEDKAEAGPADSSPAQRRGGDDLGDDFLLDDNSAKKKKNKNTLFRHK